MKPTPLLSDEPQTARLMLKEFTSAVATVRESEARAGRNCDRWGHPCAGCLERQEQTKADVPISSAVKQRGK